MSKKISKFIEKQRFQRIFWLAMPIIGGMLSQHMLNLVDTAMVGTLGDPALAAVGLGGFATLMCSAMVAGVSSGVQAIVSRYKGSGKIEQMARPLNTALFLVLLIAPILSLVLFFLIPLFYPYLNQDPEVIKLGVPYLQVRIIAIVFIGINYAFRGYWNAIDLSRLYMSAVIIMHIFNVILNYLLIFGKFGIPEMGVTGAGLGTCISTIVGTLCYFFLGKKYASNSGFLKSLSTRKETKTLIRLSVPSGIQRLFLTAGFIVLYWIVGKIGTRELSAVSVLINVALFAALPAFGLGFAAATLVGQALGRKDPNDAFFWGWDVVKIGFIALAILGSPMLLIPDIILSIFIHTQKTIEIAMLPMRIMGVAIAVEAIGLILMHALLGAGAAKQATLVSLVTQWGFFLPLAYVAGLMMDWGLLGIWCLYGSCRAIEAFIYTVIWRRRQWTKIKL